MGSDYLERAIESLEKRQRTGAVQNLSEFPQLQDSAKRLGLRLSSAALVALGSDQVKAFANRAQDHRRTGRALHSARPGRGIHCERGRSAAGFCYTGAAERHGGIDTPIAHQRGACVIGESLLPPL
jgi:hypothetical protein